MSSGVDIVVLGVDISDLKCTCLERRYKRLGLKCTCLERRYKRLGLKCTCLERRYTHLGQLGVRTRSSMTVSGTRGHRGEGGGRENAR